MFIKIKTPIKLKYIGKHKRVIGRSASLDIKIGTIVKLYKIKDSKEPCYGDIIVFKDNIPNRTILTKLAWEKI